MTDSARDICPKCGSMYSLHNPTCNWRETMTDNTTKLWNKLRSARQHRKEQQEQHWQDEVLNLKAQIARLELKNAELAAVTSQQSQTITELREIIGKLKCK